MSTALLTPTTGSRYVKTSAEARPNRLPLAYTLWAATRRRRRAPRRRSGLLSGGMLSSALMARAEERSAR